MEEVRPKIRFSVILKKRRIFGCDRRCSDRSDHRDKGIPHRQFMTNFTGRIVVIAVFVTALTFVTFGQVKKPLPFGPGETLTYDAKISKIISGVPVGELTLAVTKGDDPDELVVKADAKSKGTVLWLARFSFLYQ